MTDLLHLRHYNEGATMPLVIPVQVLVNTPVEVLIEHILENSKNCHKWVKQEVAHEGVALLCGSGASLKDDLEDIRAKVALGAKVFALNAAATFLNENGIYPDYQVIIDAKEESVSLIGDAKEHMFGSTVDPKCFSSKPDATLFQLQVEDDQTQDEIDSFAPHEYSMLSTAVSVGIVATVLSFTLGYREIHLYGYDSSHKDGESHVIRQKMNDVVPCMDVDFCGKKYLSSYPMKIQAERLMQVTSLLKGEGCKIEVHGTGLFPDMYGATLEELSEKEKYSRMWSMLSYREDSPAERIVDTILDVMKPTGKIIDFGCGTGRAAKRITDKGFDVLLTDFTSNSRDEEAANLPFIELDLTEPMPIRAEYGYCVDVMEHIPTDNVDDVIQNIMQAAKTVFFQISTVPDRCGVTIGHELHLTVRPLKWWKQKFESFGFSVSHETESDIDCKLLATRKER